MSIESHVTFSNGDTVESYVWPDDTELSINERTNDMGTINYDPELRGRIPCRLLLPKSARGRTRIVN
jgi:hypothetical protein